MQPANQLDYSKCMWGDIDCASALWSSQKDMQQPVSQTHASKLWAGPDEPPEPVPRHIGRTSMKNVLHRASQTSNRPHAKLQSRASRLTLLNSMRGPEHTAVAAIQPRMRMRILTRPDNPLANFSHQISNKKLRITHCEGIR